MLYDHRYNKLREALLKTRNDSGLTQVELASKLKRGQSYVSKVERGEQFVDVLEFIQWCEACDTAPAEVIAGI